MITKFTVLELKVTPQLLRRWAKILEERFEKATCGDEVPSIDIPDWNTHSKIILRGDQEAFHRREKGDWS